MGLFDVVSYQKILIFASEVLGKKII